VKMFCSKSPLELWMHFSYWNNVPRNGYLPRPSQRLTGFPKWLNWNEYGSEAIETQTLGPLRGNSMDWETGRGSAISCPHFGGAWQPLRRKKDDGMWEWGVWWGKLRPPMETTEEGSMLKGKGGDRKPPLNCL
jgi:hypothetical protein